MAGGQRELVQGDVGLTGREVEGAGDGLHLRPDRAQVGRAGERGPALDHGEIGQGLVDARVPGAAREKVGEVVSPHQEDSIMTGGQRLIERNRGLHPARIERRGRDEVRVEDGEGRSLIIHSNQLDITIQPEEIDLLLKSDHQGSGAILETGPVGRIRADHVPRRGDRGQAGCKRSWSGLNQKLPSSRSGRKIPYPRGKRRTAARPDGAGRTGEEVADLQRLQCKTTFAGLDSLSRKDATHGGTGNGDKVEPVRIFRPRVWDLATLESVVEPLQESNRQEVGK